MDSEIISKQHSKQALPMLHVKRNGIEDLGKNNTIYQK
jgi:hypothetical protein